MIYWHVERSSLCIHSQLKSPSSSEVASMIEGVIHHCTEMEVDRQYVDSHGQSTVAFAFCRLLGFQLLPRLKAIHSQKLYRPETGKADAYANLQQILTKPIDWDSVRQQYDQMVKYATALRLGTAETEAILRRFTKKNVQHPTYKAFAELGKAIKTIFLCRYLHDEALRRKSTRAERSRAVERRDRLRVLRPPGRDGEQPPRGSRGQHARAAPDPELYGLHQHADDPEGLGPAALAGQVHTTRLRRPDAADLGTRQPVWSVRSRYEHPARP
jgi:hypothetical protein